MTFRWQKAEDRPQMVQRVRRSNNPHVELVKAVKIGNAVKRLKLHNVDRLATPSQRRIKSKAVCHNDDNHYKERRRAVGVLRDIKGKPWTMPDKRKMNAEQKKWGIDLPICRECLEECESYSTDSTMVTRWW